MKQQATALCILCLNNAVFTESLNTTLLNNFYFKISKLKLWKNVNSYFLINIQNVRWFCQYISRPTLFLNPSRQKCSTNLRSMHLAASNIRSCSSLLVYCAFIQHFSHGNLEWSPATTAVTSADHRNQSTGQRTADVNTSSRVDWNAGWSVTSVIVFCVKSTGQFVQPSSSVRS